MKSIIVSLIVLLGSAYTLWAQVKSANPHSSSFGRYTGTYRPSIDTTSKYNIRFDNGHLIIAIEGQGQTDLDSVSVHRFRVRHVKPEAFIEFVEDSLGKISKFLWLQPIHLTWIKTHENESDSTQPDENSPQQYVGIYKLKSNSYASLTLRYENGQLSSQPNNEGRINLTPLEKDKYVVQSGEKNIMSVTFLRGKSKRIEQLVLDRKEGVDLVKMEQTPESELLSAHISNRQNGFTRADTLRGMLSALRTCYDVLFYHLDIAVDPPSKMIRGSSQIRFKAMTDFNQMQIDLYANMTIDSILSHGQKITYTREYDAVFLQFPKTISKGSVEEVSVFYNGHPQIPNLSIPMHGGFLWLQNMDGKVWVESVCQGSGASLWWPCKDHLSDKPDSMRISVTVPTGLTDISNGRLLSKVDLPGKLTRFDWYVSYPINNYNVVVNIGDYAHFSDVFIRHSDTLTLDYYCMPYNLEKAKELFAEVKPMLQRYEHYFGAYPFPKDGFTVMESLYPMEHQSAVSIGQIDKKHFDFTEMRRLMWHECAHEWWGNSVSCKDLADFWIHEAFATYTEYLNTEALQGKDAALKQINTQHAGEKEPMIGVYNVNHIHYDIGDMYSKGSLMLNTLRSLINNDSTWFVILRGIQENFKYQTVTTKDITDFINEKSGTDYTYFFDQYLREPLLPELQIKLSGEKNALAVQYKWNSALQNFQMPIKITRSKDQYDLIHPTTAWQTMKLEHLKAKDFHVATNEFYIKLRIDSESQ